MTASVYRLGEYKVIRTATGQLEWEAHAGFGSFRTGRCFRKGSILFIGDLHLSTRGLLLAVASGSVASGLGYVTWYAALKGLTSTRAATVQLSVPVIAAIGGVLMLAEPVTLRLVLLQQRLWAVSQWFCCNEPNGNTELYGEWLTGAGHAWR